MRRKDNFLKVLPNQFLVCTSSGNFASIFLSVSQGTLGCELKEFSPNFSTRAGHKTGEIQTCERVKHRHSCLGLFLLLHSLAIGK